MLEATAAYLAYEAQPIGATPAIRASLLRYDSAGVLQETVDITEDIEQAGTVTMEAPVDFSDLVAGDHSGLTLNNRQGSFVAGVWVPAPKYSPNKSSFIFAGVDWSNLQLKIELGWKTGGWFEAGWMEYAWFEDDYTDFITIFLGKIQTWGPVTRSVGDGGEPDPVTVEIYAVDWIMDCLQKRVALPDENGIKTPLTYGEFLVEPEKITGTTPATLIKEATFEDNDLLELDAVIEAGGGDVSVVAPGLIELSDYCMRASTSGANQSAFGELGLTTVEIFATWIMQFTSSVLTLGGSNRRFLRVLDSAGTVLIEFYVAPTGIVHMVNVPAGGSIETTFNMTAYQGIPISVALWVSDAYYTGPPRCVVRLWINGEEVLGTTTTMSITNPRKIRFGIATLAESQTWELDYDNIELYDTYYDMAYQIKGYPFADIKEVYIDGAPQPDEKATFLQSGTQVTQYIERFPSVGMVIIRAEYPGGVPVWNYTIDGTIMVKAVENDGGRHALEMIELLLAEAGLTALIDTDSLAAAYLAVPNDILTGARFEGGGEARQLIGMKDYASFGMTIADCIKEICSRVLYWFFMESGKIKIIPYTGVAPADPAALALDGSSLFEASPTIDFSQVRNFVAATYGWYERNVAFYYIAGTPIAGGTGTELDFSWQSPVASESRALVVAKADLLNIFSSPQEIMDPVRTHLIGARVELMKDVVSIDDVILSDAPINYWINRKEIALDPDEYQVTLQPLRVLGEI